ncbi:hypothetical protein EKH57_02930 [Halorubrum sp. BOL3-1]|uniref:hypothetical protein n=1 Tax=Halorubrum sp. BOL3-1 TaxID=2497325 RepID=UPI0010051D30|nr:hypothetical protein [Halorubrum sp. BOL3-1]QAU11791.1 hypothetical protein EKH57_02930 [Halorubrum sp. BOL3-1]
MAHDPLSPAEALRTRAGTALAAVSVLVFAYSILVLGQLLLGTTVAGGLTVGLYLTYHTLAVLDSVADAAQRFAAAKEREVDPTGDRRHGGTHVESDETNDDRTRTTAEFTERER